MAEAWRDSPDDSSGEGDWRHWARRLRSALEEAVRRRPTRAILLSGGLDTGILAHLLSSVAADKRCPDCGRWMSLGRRFCKRCGAWPVPDPGESTSDGDGRR
ncbi:MAG: hypothetical protein ACOC5E_02805 [Acidobacteriota bacterium]